MLRAGILRAADDRHVQRFMGRYGMRLGAARFVAGETLDECVAVLRRLAADGLHTNTTLLGESVRDRAEAEAVADEYGRILERLHREKLPCNVALKLTHLGLDIDEELAYANVERVVGMVVVSPAPLGPRSPKQVPSGTLKDTPATAVVAGYSLTRSRTVLQSYLFRTEPDLESLLPLAPNLRFVKGRTSNRRTSPIRIGRRRRCAYLRLVETALSGGAYAAIATHDEALIERCLAFAERRGSAATASSSRCSSGSGRDSSSTSFGAGTRFSWPRRMGPSGTRT